MCQLREQQVLSAYYSLVFFLPVFSACLLAPRRIQEMLRPSLGNTSQLIPLCDETVSKE